MTTYEVQDQPIHTDEETYEPGDTIDDPPETILDAFADNLVAQDDDEGDEGDEADAYSEEAEPEATADVADTNSGEADEPGPEDS